MDCGVAEWKKLVTGERMLPLLLLVFTFKKSKKDEDLSLSSEDTLSFFKNKANKTK